MSSKREEERNEKIIRGLMKLPPNRRCINCNILGPQYVCTNFWTFVCMTCSGIHREFTHRVKSVSMAKFTSQEVDALQKGGNQRARELFMKSWDPQRQRLPDNSNIDKLREFIKNIYVDRKYVTDKSSDNPPNDPQRSCEDGTRRASSYHSYSQSPPYDFQYEQRRYGKHAPVLSRKPGSDRGMYNGKLASFLSPSRFSDHVADDRFANEGSCPRISDYSVSAGTDPFRTGIHSPSSQRDIGSPLSDTSRDFSAETPQDSGVSHTLDGDRKGGGARVLQPQRTASGSFGSYSSNFFKSVNSLGVAEAGSGPDKPTMISLEKSYSLPPLPQPSSSVTFSGLDLFEAPSAPQTVASTAPIGTNSWLPESSVAQSTTSFQQTTIAPVSMFTELQHSQIPQSSSLELNTMEPKQQLVSSSAEKTSDIATPINGGWASFDTPQNFVHLGTENSAPVPMNVGGNAAETSNPFFLAQKSSYQDFANHGSLTSDLTLWHESMHNVEPSLNNNRVWNAFEDFNLQTFQTVLHNNEKPVPNVFSDADKILAFDVYKAGTHANSHKSSNPFDLPDDATSIEPGNMFWEMGSLQAALPNTQDPTSYVSGLNQSWFTPNVDPTFVSNGLSFEPPNGSLEFIAGQEPTLQVQNIHAQGHVAAPVGGNPFA